MDWNPERVLVYRKSADVMATRVAASPNHARKQRVGIWDLDASAGSLPHVLDAIEDAQTYFSFYCVEAAFQIGLTAPGDHVALEWRQRTGRTMGPDEAAMNVRARPIVAAAQPILDALPIDWLVVVVKSMIADTSDLDDSWYNLFATTHDRIILISTSGLREYAATAGRPFESAVVGTALAMLVGAMVPDIEQIHGRSTGSIFDFCEIRSDIVRVIRSPKIDPENRARIPEEILEPTEKILDVLIHYKGSTTPAQIRRQRQMSRRLATKSKVSKIGFKMSFNSVLKALDASLPKTAMKKRAVAKKHAKKKVAKRRGK